MSSSRSSPCRRVSIVLLALLPALLLSGCAAPTQFRPARTLKEGKFETSLTFDGIVYTHAKREKKPSDYDVIDEGPILVLPTPLPQPGFAIRYGITNGLEFGGGFSITTLRLDLTGQILETPLLDLAVGAGVGTEHIFLVPIVPAVSVPLLVGINLSSWLTLTPYVAAAGWIPIESFDVPLLVAETGIGLEIRPTTSFSLRPHFVKLWPLGPREQPMTFVWDEPFSNLYSFGVDLVFGGSRY